MSTSFAAVAATSDTPALDPTKHVLYQLGMVLGVADLGQDFAYLSGRGDVAVRELGGYGTTSGLRVVADVDPRGPRILVEPGTAYSPAGKLVRVCKPQCAYLDDWLLQNKTDVATKRDQLSNTATIYVVLCYRDCPTDNVPIPGAPCRTEEEDMQPSRLTDDFTLDFRWHNPDRKEADAIAAFVHWLRRVKGVSFGRTLTVREFEEELLADEEAILASRCGDDYPIASPPDSPPSSPPHIVFSEFPIPIPTGQECEYLKAAFRMWTTRFRPRVHPDLMAGSCGCDGGVSTAAPLENCLMLAEIVIPLAPSGTAFVVNRREAVEVREKCRATLLDLQMLQEYLFCSVREQGAEAFDLLPGPVTAATSFGLSKNDGSAAQYARADHSHGTPPFEILSKKVAFPGSIGIVANGQTLVFNAAADQWEPGTVVAQIQPAPSPVRVVAAGVFDALGKPIGKTFGNLTAHPFASGGTPSPLFNLYTLKFDEFKTDGTYVVNGTAISPGIRVPIHVFERVVETVLPGLPPHPQTITVRVVLQQGDDAKPGFNVEISEIV